MKYHQLRTYIHKQIHTRTRARAYARTHIHTYRLILKTGFLASWGLNMFLYPKKSKFHLSQLLQSICGGGWFFFLPPPDLVYYRFFGSLITNFGFFRGEIGGTPLDLQKLPLLRGISQTACKLKM